jgi:HEAT repeat protein
MQSPHSIPEPGSHPDPRNPDFLIKELESKDGVVREKARHQLVQLGARATDRLIGALGHPREQVRWEAAKALESIADTRAIPALVASLEDEDSDVRWVAADALIAIGHECLEALVEAVVRSPDSTWLREGAHHVLHDLRDDEPAEWIAPVYEAIEMDHSESEVYTAAVNALAKLRELDRKR